jgi:hypothetical protein
VPDPNLLPTDFKNSVVYNFAMMNTSDLIRKGCFRQDTEELLQHGIHFQPYKLKQPELLVCYSRSSVSRRLLILENRCSHLENFVSTFER